MGVQSPSFPVPNAFEVLCAQYAKRLPARLEDLAGPSQGTVDLPLQVAWSRRRSYEARSSPDHGWACTERSSPRASAKI
jgi:hypothetical protein